MIENLQREDLHPWYEGQAFKEYMERFGVSYQDLAERIGKSTDYVFARVHIAERVKVPNPYALSFTELRELSRVREPKVQRVLVQEVHKRGLTTDELHERVQEVRGTAPKQRRIGRFRCRLCGESFEVFHIEKSGEVSHRLEEGGRK